MFAMRALLKIQIRMCFISILQRAYQHERIAARFYHALSNQQIDGIRRSSILQLAKDADRNAQHYAVRLSLLKSSSTRKDEIWSDRFWYWSLLHCPVNLAMWWIEWAEHKDNNELDALFSAKEFWQ